MAKAAEAAENPYRNGGLQFSHLFDPSMSSYPSHASERASSATRLRDAIARAQVHATSGDYYSRLAKALLEASRRAEAADAAVAAVQARVSVLAAELERSTARIDKLLLFRFKDAQLLLKQRFTEAFGARKAAETVKVRSIATHYAAAPAVSGYILSACIWPAFAAAFSGIPGDAALLAEVRDVAEDRQRIAEAVGKVAHARDVISSLDVKLGGVGAASGGGMARGGGGGGRWGRW